MHRPKPRSPSKLPAVAVAACAPEDGDDVADKSLRHFERLPTGSDARALNDLGNDLMAEGDVYGAEPVLRRALAIAEASLGVDHRDTAICLGNVARVVVQKGDLDQGEELHRSALRIKEATLGPDHPGTAATYVCLADLLHEKGNAPEAEELYRKALEVKRAVLGLHNKSTICTLDKLASLSYARGDASGAEALLRHSLAAKEAALGDRGLGVAACSHGLASVLCELGRPAEAEPLMARALSIHGEVQGAAHPTTKACSRDLETTRRLVLQAQNKCDSHRLHRAPLAGAVTVGWLLGFAEKVTAHFPDLYHPTTADVVKRIVLPETEAACQSYAESEAPAAVNTRGSSSVAPPQFVVCHSWDRPFMELVRSLAQRFQYAHGTLVWLDFLSMTLHSPGAAPLVETFQAAASEADGVLLVTDPAGSCFLRAGPIYQIYAAGSHAQLEHLGKLEMLPYLLDFDSCPMLSRVVSSLDARLVAESSACLADQSPDSPESQLNAAASGGILNDPAAVNAVVRAAVAEGIAGLVGCVVSAALDTTRSATACARAASRMSSLLHKEGLAVPAEMLLSQPDIAELILAEDTVLRHGGPSAVGSAAPRESPQAAHA